MKIWERFFRGKGNKFLLYRKLLRISYRVKNALRGCALARTRKNVAYATAGSDPNEVRSLGARVSLAKLFFIVSLLVAAAVFFSGCGGDTDSETKDKIDKANDKAAELDEEAEKDKIFEFRMEEEGAVLTKYNGEEEDVEIPAVYKGEPVIKISSNVFKGCKEMKSLTIPPSIKEMGNNILDEATGIVIRGYENTAAEFLAYTISGLQFESLGENKQKAGSVKIFDLEGVHYTTLFLGDETNKDFLEGVSFQEKNGESVLRLENASIGSLVVDEYASLVIELAEGSVNHIDSQRGRNGISSQGAVTITGAGALYVNYSVQDGGNRKQIGYGIDVSGNLTIEKAAAVYVKAGSSESDVNIGVHVFGGNLTVSDAKLEAEAGQSVSTAPGILVEAFFGRSENGGKILLQEASVTGGGSIVPYMGTYYDESTGGTREAERGSSISGEKAVTWTDEDAYQGASGHVIIDNGR